MAGQPNLNVSHLPVRNACNGCRLCNMKAVILIQLMDDLPACRPPPGSRTGQDANGLLTLVRDMYRLADTLLAYSRWTGNALDIKTVADDAASTQRHLSKRYGTARGKHLDIAGEPFVVSCEWPDILFFLVHSEV